MSGFGEGGCEGEYLRRGKVTAYTNANVFDQGNVEKGWVHEYEKIFDRTFNEEIDTNFCYCYIAMS